jgi:hypothetical protein
VLFGHIPARGPLHDRKGCFERAALFFHALSNDRNTKSITIGGGTRSLNPMQRMVLAG